MSGKIILFLALASFLLVLPLAAQEGEELQPPVEEQGEGPAPSEGQEGAVSVPLDQAPNPGTSEDGGQGPAGVPSDFDAPPDQGGPAAVGDAPPQDATVQVEAAPEQAPAPKASPRKKKRKAKMPAPVLAQDPAAVPEAAAVTAAPEEPAETAAAKPAKSRKARGRGKAAVSVAQAKAGGDSKAEEVFPLPATPFSPSMP
ncbi:MAG: hypothetical protein HZB91_10100 [Elusimicrobia bacterium]|nr:hypothetical protein [Elusimicrobiota bacterium]